MRKLDEKVIYTEALKKWGLETQIKMCIEELSELIQVLAKYGRKINGSNEVMITEEIADVEIMLEQMKIGLGIHEVWIEDFKREKLERLEGFLKGEKK